MTQDLVFRLLPEKEAMFRRHLEELRTSEHGMFVEEYTSIHTALEESAHFFYSHLPQDEVNSTWLDIYLHKADADALSQGINRLWTGAPTKPSTPYHQAVYHRFTQYALTSGFGEMVPERQAEQAQKDRFLALLEEPEPVKPKAHNKDRPRFYSSV